ncbi:excinuclease ABC subunit B [Bacillus subtilis]|nr:excinuclease ABC subunit B [Bacillus subtilis]
MKDRFELVSKYQPQGDQPKAIEKLVKGIQEARSIRLCWVQQELGKHLRCPI